MIKCRVCNKEHPKKKCKYQCRYCDMYGSHTSDKCFKKFPHLKKDGKGGKRGYDRSKSRSKSRGRSRYDKDSSSRGKSVSRVRSREREDERRREEERHRDRNRGREESRERERDRRPPTPQLARRVRPRNEQSIFDDEVNDSFEQVRDPKKLTKPIRRVKEVKESLNREVVTEAEFEELVSFMKELFVVQKGEEKHEEETKDDSL